MQKRALLILAKEPRPGKSKTRMTPPLTPAEAATLSFAFIRDTLSAASQVRHTDVYLFYSPRTALPYFQDLVAGRFSLLPQEGRCFTKRCARSVEVAFAKGYERIVQIGTDTPQIRSTHITEAFSVLDTFDMAFGPANDGGYYLLALRRPAAAIYDDVEMGTETVFATMIRNARAEGLSLRTLPEWVDADTFEDLSRLEADRQHTLGRHTRNFLASLGCRRKSAGR